MRQTYSSHTHANPYPPKSETPCRCPHLRAFHKNVLLVQLQLVDEVIIGRIVNKTAAAVRDNEVVAASRADGAVAASKADEVVVAVRDSETVVDVNHCCAMAACCCGAAARLLTLILH